MDKSDQQQPTPPETGAISYANQEAERFKEIQRAYLDSRKPGDFWPGDIVLVDSRCELIGHFTALVLGRLSRGHGTVYAVSDVGLFARGRGFVEIYDEYNIVAPILLSPREGRNG